MKEEDIYIKAKKVSGQLSGIIQKHESEDLSELKEWLERNDEAKEVIGMLMDSSQLTERMTSYHSFDKESAKKSLRKRIIKHRQHQRIMLWSSIAAFMVVLLGTGIFLKYSAFSHKKMPNDTPVLALTSPTLITDHGENINLTNTPGDSILYFSGGHIIRNDKGFRQIQNNSTGNENRFNQLIIPRQCNYQIILCDGSIVHLNAESRLEYPSQFTGNERKVRLTGEGYFEIKHDGRPFIVEARQVNIRVYGTKFNVRAYESYEVKTALIEGKIGVSLQNSPTEEQILKPSELSSINLLTQQQEIINTNVEKYTAWTTGFLRYDADRLEDLIKDISRWYDIDFSFAEQKLKEIRISASINKDASLEDIISMIETAAYVKISHTERRYTIVR